MQRSKDSSGNLKKKRKTSVSPSKSWNKDIDYKFIGNGTYGCVISPPYFEKNDISKVYVKYINQDANDVGKLFKTYDGFLDELDKIQQVIEIDPRNLFTIKMKGAIVYNNMFIQNDTILDCLSYTDENSVNTEDEMSEVDDDFKSSESDLANELLAAISPSHKSQKDGILASDSKMKSPYNALRWGEIIFENGGVTVSKMFKLSYTDCLSKLQVFLKGIKKLQEHNLVHQDIKPANVLISPVKISLIDFGMLAKNDKIYHEDNLHLLSYSKYKYYPPEYTIIAIMMKKHWNTFSNISDIQAQLDAPDGFFNNYFFVKHNQYEVKFRKGIIRFFKEIKKRNLTKVSDVFNSEMALKVDVFSIAFVICCFDKHIQYTNNDEKRFINDLYKQCIEPNPFERISIKELYDLVKKENKRLKITQNNFDTFPLSNFNLMDMSESINHKSRLSNTGGASKKLITTECNRVSLKLLRQLS